MAEKKKRAYSGPRASKVYDARFEPSHRVPHLGDRVPQGLATWSGWNDHDDLLLISSYAPGDRKYAYLIGLNAKSGTHVGTAKIAASHVGGVAVFGDLGWAYVSSNFKYRVRKYALEELKQAIVRSTFLRQQGEDVELFGSSFLASHGPSATLWAGRFDADERDYMHCYEVRANGVLRPRDGVWQVPRATQGLVVTKDVFVYSCSYGRNNRSWIYVVRRGDGSSDLDETKLARFRAPSMSEGMTLCGADVYLAYESGARAYNTGGDKPRNVIGRLHRAPLASLRKLCPSADRP
jgi:hypothetical protein